MKSKKISLLKDSALFMISKRKGAAVYKLQSKKKGIATYTSENSGRTFVCSTNNLVYPLK